jgi:hypothetical protein
MANIVNRFPSTSPDQDGFICQNLEPFFGAVSLPAAGAIAQEEGTVLLDDASAGAYTLAAPVAGLPGVVSGGMDGKRLRLITQTAEAHTVTTPANAINGVHHIITFGGAVGDSIELTAFGGVWYANPSAGGVTIS